MTGSTAVPTAPATKGISQVQEADAGDQKFVHQNQIADAQRDVNRDAGHVQKISAQIAEAREKLPEFDTVADLEGQLEVARKSLAQSEANNKAINDLKDERSKAYYTLKAGKYELSQLLIKFIAKYQQRSVTVNFVATEIDITAKLGKELEEQQVLPL